MTLPKIIAILVSALVAAAASGAIGTAAADARMSAALVPYTDYIAYVTTLRARTSGDQVLAVATNDPTAARCFANAASRTEREVCQHFLQEKALVEALPTIAIAARAKLALAANPEEPSREAMVPIAQACANHADRLAETGIAPLRKIGPYTIGLLKSKLCNELLVATAAH